MLEIREQEWADFASDAASGPATGQDVSKWATDERSVLRRLGALPKAPVLALSGAFLLIAVFLVIWSIGTTSEQVASAPPATASPTTPTTTVPAPLADVMTDTFMTSEARRIFLDANPQLSDKATVAAACGDIVDAQTAGCFVEGASGAASIHMMRIDRPDLTEYTYVIAAHEMLHAAYQLYGESERQWIDREVEAAAAQLPRCRVDHAVQPYEPSERLSELHSFLGTEFAPLPPSLEQYYAQFFTNRAYLVAVHKRILGALEDRICALGAELDSMYASLTAENQELDALSRRRRYGAYNSRVGPYNAMVADYRRKLSDYDQLGQAYDAVLNGLGGSGATPHQPPPVVPRV